VTARVALIDTGPLVALLDADDAHHARCAEAFRTLTAPPVTTWPVLTVASSLLAAVEGGQAALLELVRRGAVRVSALDEADVPRLLQLMGKYADLPADLADCSLLRFAAAARHDQLAMARIQARADRLAAEAPDSWPT
jgi:predicted nucleic acid-binding protein